MAYLVTVPASCSYAFLLGKGIQGLLWGAATGNVCQALGFAYCILSKDWYEISREAVERIKKDDEKQKEKRNSKTLDEDDDYVKV